MKTGPVLMSPENPEGWKLEELLERLRREIVTKCEKIHNDKRPVARAVLRNNEQIIGLLFQAEALQRDSYDKLDAMAPNEGPLGKPRIGAGSDQQPPTIEERVSLLEGVIQTKADKAEVAMLRA